ncbi:Eco57I restriction-modification methylase domain-containing protein [Microbacterium paulum]
MTTPAFVAQAGFSLRGHNPDVLTCIANLSNDEVFTPPELAGQMLDTVADAWAADHDGASIWQNPDVTFLDPFTKSGIFLREITRRLTEGLAEVIPDLQGRVDHILTKQVYGIGITQLTALLARRSVYCSKDATGKFSVAKGFDRDWGNIWFERTEHTWAGDRCAYCGAQRGRFERNEELETHAYAFTHTLDIKSRLAQMFGADVHFDVIIGNPPYQMAGAAGGSSDASIYHRFVEQAQKLDPTLLSMVTPSRWLAGGRGLDDFRNSMLGGHKLRTLVDYPMSAELFPGVEVKGGISYFLWDRSYDGDCSVTVSREGVAQTSMRRLDQFDVLVRDPRAAEIVGRVIARGELSITEILARDTPFGLASNFDSFVSVAGVGVVDLHYIRRMKRATAKIERSQVIKNANLIDAWKVLVPEAYNGGDGLPHQIVGKPLIAPPPSACTQSYLFFRCESADEAESIKSYYATRFFRFLVSLRKITQHAIYSTYSWVPIQTWDRVWTDADLYAKYGLTDEEINFIESQIKPMVLEDSELADNA